MNKIKISIIFALCFIFSFQELMAQGGTNGDDGVTDEVQVLSSFNAKLMNSNKLRTTPTIPANNTSQNERLVYTLPTRLLELIYEPPVIRPLTMKNEKLPKIYNFYGKVGYGTPNSPFAELRYNAGRSDKLDYGLFLKHHSANNNKNVFNQQFSNTDFDANVTAYTKGFGIGGNVGYTFDQYNFYGINAFDSFVPTDTIQQRFNTIRLGTHFFNANPTAAGVNYRGNLDMYRIGGSYAETDLGVNFNGQFTKAMNRNTLAVDLYNDFNTYNQDTVQAANNILGIKPSYKIVSDDYSLKLGVNLGTESDSGFFVLPDLEASYNFSDQKFTILAGWTGEVQKNSFYSTTEQNPFVFVPQDLRNTKINKFFGGVKVALEGVQFQGIVSQKLVRNLQMYQNDSTSSYRFFNAVYDDGSIFNIHGEVLVTMIKNLEIDAVFDFNTYNLDNQARAWHLPNFEGNISAAYRLLDDKLKVKAEFYLANSIPYLDEIGDEQVLAGVADLSLGATYTLNEKFGVFLDLNNVTAQKYVRYYRYPNFGFNVLVGVTGRF